MHKPVPDRGGVGAGGTCPHPPEEAAVSVINFFRTFICTVMFWWCLGCFGVFEAVGFQNRNLAHYMYVDALVVFGVFWVGLGYFEP